MFQENVGLKNRIKELESSSGGDQAQFRDLQAKLEAALRDNSNLKTENDRLNQRIKDLERELADFKSKLGQVDNSLASKLQTAERRIQDLEKELQNWQKKYNTDKANWEAEMKKLKDLLDQRTRELDEFRRNSSSSADGLNQQLRKYETQLKDLELKVPYLFAATTSYKFKNLQQENDRLN